jgi:hypothetical protein
VWRVVPAQKTVVSIALMKTYRGLTRVEGRAFVEQRRADEVQTTEDALLIVTLLAIRVDGFQHLLHDPHRRTHGDLRSLDMRFVGPLE